MIESGRTELHVEWSPEACAWVFVTRRDNLVWQWTVTAEQFKDMLERLQAMDDELNCALGAKLRDQVNKGDE
jgi:hypothetical protein